jgi:hypothetical protein
MSRHEPSVGCEPTLNQVAGTTKRLIGSAARLNDEEAALLHSRSELVRREQFAVAESE